jgi:hypothetical protein
LTPAQLKAVEALLTTSSLAEAAAGLGDSAAGALRDALNDGEKIMVRIRAAEVVIGNLLKLREWVELEQRIAELEAHIVKRD